MGLRIRCQEAGRAEIYISGSIVDDEMGGAFEAWGDSGTGYEWPAEIRRQLDSLRGKDLSIYINSDGGQVNAGAAIASMVARHDGHTVAVVDGWCCSIATQIFFAADERRMPSNAWLMIHKPTVEAFGDADFMRRMADALDSIQEGMETAYRKVAREGVTDERIHEMTNAETWLTGKEAAEIFDIHLTGAVAAEACAGTGSRFFRGIPGAIRLRGAAPGSGAEAAEAAAAAERLAAARTEIAVALTKGAMI